GFVSLNRELPENALLCPMIDARRLEVYTAVFNGEVDLKQPTKAQIIDAAYFDDVAADVSAFYFVDGAEKFKDMFVGEENVQIISNFRQSAAYLSELSYKVYLDSNFEDVAYFEPFYLKDFVPLKAKAKE